MPEIDFTVKEANFDDEGACFKAFINCAKEGKELHITPAGVTGKYIIANYFFREKMASCPRERPLSLVQVNKLGSMMTEMSKLLPWGVCKWKSKFM